jgi:hypothetical protein
MDSITAHASVLSLMASGAATPPDQWRHDGRDGSLTCRYDGSPNTFTWDAAAVAELAARAGDDEVLSADASQLLERWRSVELLLAADELPSPDYFSVDHAGDEFTLVWEDRKLVVVIGGNAATD